MLARIKFEINGLVNEILDRLPADVFKSSTTTFLDPAMAGGQFVVEIIRRLRYNGHSDANIAERVWGLAEDAIDLNYAINTKKLIGKYSVGNIETLEQWAMAGKKFDVVLGNPPYQNDAHVGSNQKNSQMPLWGLFVKQAQHLVKEDGFIGFVTPNSWLHSNSIAYKTMVSKNLLHVDLTSKKYFAGVGTTNCYWVMKNDTDYSGTQFADELSTISVQLKGDTFIPGTITNGFVTALTILNKTVNSSSKMGASISYQHDTSAKKHKLSKVKSTEFCYEIAHTNTASLWSNEQAKHQNQIKVLVSLTGSLMKAGIDQTKGTSHIMGYIPVATMNEASVCLSVIRSKLYRFIVQSCRYSASIPAALFKALPAVDLTRSWTDAELYAHFNLTQEEIDLIEATVK